MKKTYTGSCHCGAVQYQAELDLAAGTSRCNCSFCTKARFWLAFAKAAEFKLLRGNEALADYQYVPAGKSESFLHFHFCRICGMRPFTKGGHLPALGGEFYAINVSTLATSTGATVTGTRRRPSTATSEERSSVGVSPRVSRAGRAIGRVTCACARAGDVRDRGSR
jgi:hypothetical protein